MRLLVFATCLALGGAPAAAAQAPVEVGYSDEFGEVRFSGGIMPGAVFTIVTAGRVEWTDYEYIFNENAGFESWDGVGHDTSGQYRGDVTEKLWENAYRVSFANLPPDYDISCTCIEDFDSLTGQFVLKPGHYYSLHSIYDAYMRIETAPLTRYWVYEGDALPASVPEASAWLLMVCGLTCSGIALRKRRALRFAA